MLFKEGSYIIKDIDTIVLDESTPASAKMLGISGREGYIRCDSGVVYITVSESLDATKSWALLEGDTFGPFIYTDLYFYGGTMIVMETGGY